MDMKMVETLVEIITREVLIALNDQENSNNSEDGLIEIKCPNTATHIETLLNDNIDGKYRLQMMWQMRCTNRKWCDFVSFDPRMPEELQLKIIRVDYDQAEVDQIEAEVTKFLSEVDEKVKKLNEVKNGISQ